MAKPAELDEDYKKPSNHKQWNEQSNKPVITHRMTKNDIEIHRHNLIAMYGCADTDLTYGFQKIIDKADDDYDDCLFLIYRLRCVRHGKTENKAVFTIKIPIPEHLKQRADEIKVEESLRARTVRALPAPSDIPVNTLPMDASSAVTTPTTPTTPTTQTTPTVTKPTARKPAVRRAVKK